MLFVIKLIGLYLLIGAVLFFVLMVNLCKKSSIPLSKMSFKMTLTMQSGKKFTGKDALLTFIFRWPETLPMVYNSFKGKS